MNVGDRVSITRRYPEVSYWGRIGRIASSYSTACSTMFAVILDDHRFRWCYARELELLGTPARATDVAGESDERPSSGPPNISPATAGESTESPAGEKGDAVMYGINEGNLITDGSRRAVVKAATAAFIIAEPENGGDQFVLNASAASSWSVVPATLVIERPFVVYGTNGQRVDGYKFESRARRNNDSRFAGQGYWLGVMKPEYFTFVPA